MGRSCGAEERKNEETRQRSFEEIARRQREIEGIKAKLSPAAATTKKLSEESIDVQMWLATQTIAQDVATIRGVAIDSANRDPSTLCPACQKPGHHLYSGNFGDEYRCMR